MTVVVPKINAIERRSTLAPVVARCVRYIVGWSTCDGATVVAYVVVKVFSCAASQTVLTILTGTMLTHEAPVGRLIARLRALAPKRII